MIFAALKEAAEKGELILVEGGMCRWHRRRDGVVVIREILVQPWLWGQGIGRRMVEEVRRRNPGCPLLAKCPVGYEANKFWHLLGFVEVAQEKGLISWRLAPDSSGAPVETSTTRARPLPLAGNTGSDCPPEAC
jgi:hypothetical protein